MLLTRAQAGCVVFPMRWLGWAPLLLVLSSQRASCFTVQTFSCHQSGSVGRPPNCNVRECRLPLVTAHAESLGLRTQVCELVAMLLPDRAAFSVSKILTQVCTGTYTAVSHVRLPPCRQAPKRVASAFSCTEHKPPNLFVCCSAPVPLEYIVRFKYTREIDTVIFCKH